MKYSCLSVRQPWAWLIIQGYKNIENRSQRCHKRGTIALHASTTNTRNEYAAALALIADRGLDILLPPIDDLVTGAIVGLVDIVGCVTESDSPWFTGEYGWVLDNPRSGIPVPQKGQQGFFPVEYEFSPPPIVQRFQRFIEPPNYPYGQCWKCKGAVRIPGLDRYLCAGDCGWQFQLSELRRMQIEENARASNGKSQEATIAKSKKGESSLFHYEN